MITNKERIQWIDVAKTIGMFFIVLGHYFPSYLSEWIYSFNVPLFFFLSGFLCKKEESWRIFWRKNIESLIIPYFIYCFLLNLGFLFENIDNIQNLLKWLFACLLGFHSIDSLPGCLNMWFVYCLFFVKFLFQSLPDNRKIGLSICCLCLISLQIYRYYNWSLAWSFTNIPLAYPFFFLGKYCFRYKLVNKVQALRLSSSLLSVICILFFTGLLSSYNGIAFNYTGGVGNSLIIFLLCSILNIFIILVLSINIVHLNKEVASTISLGSILILAFHLFFVYKSKGLLLRFIEHDSLAANVIYIISSILICTMFIPIIRWIQVHLPLLIGKRG